MLERRIRIVNQLGLHARAAAKLVRTATRWRSAVTLRYDGTEADAGSILDVLALAAPFGAQLDIVVDGPDEEETIAVIEGLFLDGFGEL
jgi:phosphocarrier protein HPr